jgi:hypothetical protein
VSAGAAGRVAPTPAVDDVLPAADVREEFL